MRSTIGLCLVAMLLMNCEAVTAPISYLGGTYTQNFDGLPTTGSTTLSGLGPHDIQGVLGGSGVPGWTMTNNGGSSSDTEYRAQDGSLSGASGRGVVSFGTTGSSDRALGQLPTSNQIGRYGVSFTNDTGDTLNQFSLSFVGEQWRRGDITTGGTVTYEYAVGAANINSGGFLSLGSFSSPNLQASPLNVALNGNLPDNQVSSSANVTNANWTPGSTLVIRWNGADINGQDDGLAIDNVSFSASVPEPASCTLAVMTALVAAALRHRRAS